MMSETYPGSSGVTGLAPLRALCIARHCFLSEHIARYFAAMGVATTNAVGLDSASESAGSVSPDVVICDYDLLATLPLEKWERDALLSKTPVIAVSLTRHAEELQLLDVKRHRGISLPSDSRAGVSTRDSACGGNPPQVHAHLSRKRAKDDSAKLNLGMSSDPITGVFNDGYITEAYEAYRRDPASVDESWRQFFRFAESLSGAPAPAAPGQPLQREQSIPLFFAMSRPRLSLSMRSAATATWPCQSIRSARRQRGPRS